MERGAYVFCDSCDKQICLFLFQKLTDSMMRRALPCHANGTGNYYIAIYREGKDYLGRTDYTGIENLMKDEKMFSLFNTKYEDIRNGLNCEFTEDEYTKYQTFAEMHIKGFIDLSKNIVTMIYLMIKQKVKKIIQYLMINLTIKNRITFCLSLTKL